MEADALEAELEGFDELPEPDRWQITEYRGVWAEETAGGNVYEAVITVNDTAVSGGEFETPEEAARAYDALALMYSAEDATLNFKREDYTSWSPADFERFKEDPKIEEKPGVPLTVEEVVGLLERERGIDVQFLDLAERSELADYMVWVTGRSVPHMRKLGRLLVTALRGRKLPELEPELEGRDMDDWMVVDCGNIIVNIMDAEAREVFALEDMYRDMRIGVDPYEGWTHDEWLEANPIPDKWIARLEKDEVDIAAARAAKKR